jgi:TatD DNase family protein
VRFMAAELDLEVDELCRQLAANTVAVYGTFD